MVAVSKLHFDGLLREQEKQEKERKEREQKKEN